MFTFCNWNENEKSRCLVSLFWCLLGVFYHIFTVCKITQFVKAVFHSTALKGLLYNQIRHLPWSLFLYADGMHDMSREDPNSTKCVRWWRDAINCIAANGLDLLPLSITHTHRRTQTHARTSLVRRRHRRLVDREIEKILPNIDENEPDSEWICTGETGLWFES